MYKYHKEEIGRGLQKDVSHKIKASYFWVNPQQSVRLGEELLLQRDDDDLHVPNGFVPDETRHLHPTQVW